MKTIVLLHLSNGFKCAPCLVHRLIILVAGAFCLIWIMHWTITSRSNKSLFGWDVNKEKQDLLINKASMYPPLKIIRSTTEFLIGFQLLNFVLFLLVRAQTDSTLNELSRPTKTSPKVCCFYKIGEWWFAFILHKISNSNALFLCSFLKSFLF